MRKKLIYFGHPVNTYDKELEEFLLNVIKENFPKYQIENPNQECHKEGYKRVAKITGKGMDYFYKEVLPLCDAGIFLPFRDGKWGAGVYGEARKLAEQGCLIFQINADGVIMLMEDFDGIPVLSVEETRKRIRDEKGASIPY